MTTALKISHLPDSVKLRMIRRYHELPIKSMAMRTGCSNGHISNMENGVSSISPKILEEISADLTLMDEKYKEFVNALFQSYDSDKANEIKIFFDRIFGSRY